MYVLCKCRNLKKEVNYNCYLQGAVDRKGYVAVMSATLQTQDAFQQGRFKEATMLWGHTENIIRQYTYGIDFYNILKRTPYFPKSRGTQRILFTMIDYDLEEAKLARLMNGKVKSGLNLPKTVEWGGQRSETFNALTEDFLKPATDTGNGSWLAKTHLRIKRNLFNYSGTFAQRDQFKRRGDHRATGPHRGHPGNSELGGQVALVRSECILDGRAKGFYRKRVP